MPIGTTVQTEFTNRANTQGTPFTAQNRTYNFNRSGYDDLSSSGSSTSGAVIAGSCFVFPIDGKNGADAIFLQQGLITSEDVKAYIPSGAEILSNAYFIAQGGSYWVFSQHPWRINNVLIYTKLYLKGNVQV